MLDVSLIRNRKTRKEAKYIHCLCRLLSGLQLCLARSHGQEEPSGGKVSSSCCCCFRLHREIQDALVVELGSLRMIQSVARLIQRWSCQVGSLRIHALPFQHLLDHAQMQRLRATMNAHFTMFVASTSVREPPLASHTLIRLLARVDARVSGQIRIRCKCLVAVLTSIGPLSRVDADMNGQRAFLRESLSAMAAFEGFLACVSPDVRYQIGLVIRRIAAVAAFPFLAFL